MRRGGTEPADTQAQQAVADTTVTSGSGASEALCQTWTPVEVGPGTGTFVAVTKSDPQDLAYMGVGDGQL